MQSKENLQINLCRFKSCNKDMVYIMVSNVKASVIVPTWNDESRVLLCIDALKEQSIPQEIYEIIVVDNGSSDNTFEILSKIEGITLLREEKVGSYAARNKGLTIAKGEYVAFTDSDCIPERTWLEELLKSANGFKDLGVIAGEVKFFRDEYSNAEAAALNYESFFSMNQKEYANAGVCITANWLSKRDKLLELGMFNDSMKSGGDHNMAKRLTLAGYKIKYCPEAIVNHPSRNLKEILLKRRRVIGGTWDSHNSRLKVIRMLWQAQKLFVKRSMILFFQKKCALSTKFSVLKVLSFILLVSFDEIVRLYAGKSSSRS
ncbi:MAG: dolichyl-phosphate mannose synthase [Pseudomonadales bacterium]|nr:dolichyl-phosphate mannose synthase [Pseudomonadales bacterium]